MMLFLSFLLRLVATFLILLGIVFLRGALFEQVLWSILPGVASASAGAWLYNFSRKLRAYTLSRATNNDPRPFVLFLRSFSKDKAGEEAGLQAWWKKLFYLTTILPANLTTKEEQLLFAFQDIGPMKAVAKPGELLHPLGPARIVLLNAQWQQRVLQLIDEARLVVIRAGGDTGGLNWEIEQVFKQKIITRLIFLLPSSQKEYDEFSEFLRPIIRKDLPSHKTIGSIGGFSGLLYFTATGIPVIQRIKISFTSPPGTIFNDTAIGIKEALQKIGTPFLPRMRSGSVGVPVRLRARAYDQLVIIPLTVLTGSLLIFFFHRPARDAGDIPEIVFISWLLISFIYPFLSELLSVKGTFGKRKLGIYMADKAHIRPTAQQIFMRNFFILCTIFPFLMFPIIYNLFAWYKKRPLFHDYASRTRVFRTQP